MRSFQIFSSAARVREQRRGRRLKERLDAAASLVRSVAMREGAEQLSDHVLRDIGLWRDPWGRIRDAEP